LEYLKFMDHVYFKPHTRFGVYVVGIIAGYLLYQTRGKKIRIPGVPCPA
jgi:hypothetical protein